MNNKQTSPRPIPILANQMTINEQDQLRLRLEELSTEHRDLDDVIERLGEDGTYDQLKLQRLKKRKLILKDEMTNIESRLLPDIIA